MTLVSVDFSSGWYVEHHNQRTNDVLNHKTPRVCVLCRRVCRERHASRTGSMASLDLAPCAHHSMCRLLKVLEVVRSQLGDVHTSKRLQVNSIAFPAQKEGEEAFLACILAILDSRSLRPSLRWVYSSLIAANLLSASSSSETCCASSLVYARSRSSYSSLKLSQEGRARWSLRFCRGRAFG